MNQTDLLEAADSITLTLSAPEARTVVQVLNHIGGCPHNSPRRHADRVLSALLAAGVDDEEGQLDVDHGLWFSEAPSRRGALLLEAIEWIQAERDEIHDTNTERGVVNDPDAIALIARYDRWLRDARAATETSQS